MYGKSVHLYLTLRCNSKCPYCSNTLPTCETVYPYREEGSKNWIELIKRLEGFDIYLTGGEVFLFDGIADVLNSIPDRSDRIMVYTNGSLISGKLIAKMDLTKIAFRCSYHACLGSVERFLEKMRILEAKEVSFQIFMVDVPEEKALEFRVGAFRDGGYDLRVDYDQRRHVHKKGKIRCFLPTTIVSPDGTVFPCVSKMIRHKDGLGNLFKDEKLKEPELIICDEPGACTPCDLAAAYQQDYQDDQLSSVLPFKRLQGRPKVTDFIFIERDTLQHESELRALVDFVFSKKEINNILEIGTDKGGTAYVWLQLAKKKVILIDKEFPKTKVYGGGSFSPLLFEVQGDSRNEEVLEKVREILNGEEIDIFFIDGDHGYWAVKDNFEAYSQLVCIGGWIALHDVFNPFWSVQQFWKELKEKYEHWEFDIRNQIPEKKRTIWGPDKPMGIGLIRWLKQ